MALSFTPLINGYAYDWNNIEVIVSGVPITGITKIDYEINQEVKNNYSAGGQPNSRSYGNMTYSGSMELTLAAWNEIINNSPFKDPTQLPPLDITISYIDYNQSVVINYTDKLRSVSFMKHNRTHSQGDTDFKVTIPFIMAAVECFD